MPNGKFYQGESISKVPEASCFLNENGAEAIAVQRAFISHLTRKLQKIQPDKTRNECAILVVGNTAQKFREWFCGFARIETIENFVSSYGPPEGPERIFAELFPNQNIEDFLQSCLNGDESSPASRRSEVVHERAMNTINK